MLGDPSSWTLFYSFSYTRLLFISPNLDTSVVLFLSSQIHVWSGSQLVCIFHPPSNSVSPYKWIHVDAICLELWDSSWFCAGPTPVDTVYHSTWLLLTKGFLDHHLYANDMSYFFHSIAPGIIQLSKYFLLILVMFSLKWSITTFFCILQDWIPPLRCKWITTDLFDGRVLSYHMWIDFWPFWLYMQCWRNFWHHHVLIWPCKMYPNFGYL